MPLTSVPKRLSNSQVTDVTLHSNSVSFNFDSVSGQVGPPIPCSKIKMVDVKEMNYFAKDGCGEVCVFGPHVMKGYYKLPEQTKEVLDDDGWLHTGDIGRWTKDGTLKLVDRKKHIFKLSQVYTLLSFCRM